MQALDAQTLGIVVNAQACRGNRWLNGVSIATPWLLGGAACVLCYVKGIDIAPGKATWQVFVVFMVAQILGVAMGLHRYFTHRAFACVWPIKLLLALFGTWGFQGPITRWVADHRRHHRFADRAHDPHSPYWRGDTPITSRFNGFLHAHVLWMVTGQPSDEKRYASDCLSDPMVTWFTRYYWVIALIGLLAPALIALAFFGAHEAARAFIWAGCFRVLMMHQLTWSVNSIGHMFGPTETKSDSAARNNPVLTLLLLGEGLHSFHHKHGTAAVNGSGWADPIGWLVLLGEKCGLLRDLRRPTEL
jgi:stearoyl-CoA desaturase (Delta-9 desaturase)